MLDTIQLTNLFDKLGTPDKGRQLIHTARIQAPVTPPTVQGGSVATILSSKKMGREIRTETRHIEFPAAVTKEHSDDVLEYYERPCELKLPLVDDSTGEIRNARINPNFLTIRDDGFTL